MYALIWSKIGAEQKGAPRHRLTASPVQYRSLGFMFRRHPDRRARRTTISVSSGEDQKRRSCETNCRTRPHRGGTDLYIFSVGAVSYVFISNRKRKTVRRFCTTEVPVPVFLFHQSGFRADACQAANTVSHADSGLRQWA